MGAGASATPPPECDKKRIKAAENSVLLVDLPRYVSALELRQALGVVFDQKLFLTTAAGVSANADICPEIEKEIALLDKHVDAEEDDASDERNAVRYAVGKSLEDTAPVSRTLEDARIPKRLVAEFISREGLDESVGAVFFRNLQHFQRVYRAMNPTAWNRVPEKESILEIPDVDKVKIKDGDFGAGENRQMRREGGNRFCRNVGELYEAASLARPVFKRIMHKVIDGDAGMRDVELRIAPLKARNRAAEKAEEYDGRTPGPGASWVFDVVRGKVIAKTGADVLNLYKRLASFLESRHDDEDGERQDIIELIRLKNRCRSPTFSGYRDLLINFRVRVWTSDKSYFWHACELQVHPQALIDTDEKLDSHVAYEYFRSYFQGNVEALDERLRVLLSLDTSHSHSLQEIVDHTLETEANVDVERNNSETKTVTRSILELAELMRLLSEYSLCMKLRSRALELCENTFGYNAEETLLTVDKMAEILKNSGDYERARPMYERALAGWEELHGPTHTKTLWRVDWLGSLLKNVGSYKAAEPLFKRTLKCREETLGPDHVATLASVDNLSMLYVKMGDDALARPLAERAVKGYEKIRGQNHKDTIIALNNLATILKRAGQLREARPLFERCLRSREETLGPHHPTTVVAVDNLGMLLSKLGDIDGALVLFQRAARGFEHVHGADHPDTLIAINNLAKLLQKKKDFDAALPLMERVYMTRERVLGALHKGTLISIDNCGCLLMEKGDYDAAEDLFRRSSDGFEATLGEVHSSTMIALTNLSKVLRKNRDYEAALPIFQRLVDLKTKKMGPNHRHTLVAKDNLASLLTDLDEYAKALELHKEALVGFEATLGRKHSSTVICIRGMVRAMRGLGMNAEIELTKSEQVWTRKPGKQARRSGTVVLTT